MQVILFDNIDRLGLKGDVVNVANGYYRNYLGPRGLALEASAANLKRMESKRRVLKQEAEKQLQEANAFGDRLAEAKIQFTRKSPDGDKLFGSVHDHEILEQLTAQGFKIERRQIVLREPLKTVGTHAVRVRLIGNVDATVNVLIEAEEDPEEMLEAEAKAKKKTKATDETSADAAADEPSPDQPAAETKPTEAQKPAED